MWVTFGRFPEGTGCQDMDELNEELGFFSFAWRDSFGGPRYRFKGFWWYESEMAGVDLDAVDWDRYEGALRAGYQRMDALEEQYLHALEDAKEDHLRDYPGLHDVDAIVKRASMSIAFCKKAMAEHPYVESVHSQYQQSVDRGWALIFQSLVSGKLKGYGWGDLTQDEIREFARKGTLQDYDPSSSLEEPVGNVFNPWHVTIPKGEVIGPLLGMGQNREIPTKDWSLSGVAPDGRYVTASGRSWWDVCVPNEQLFDIFPRPLLASETVEHDAIEIVNPGLAIGSAGGSPMRQIGLSGVATRGRKKLADGQIEKLCHELYGARWAAGEQEAPLHAEAAALAQQVWGETLPRSTFQGYMKPFKRQPKNPPEIAAE